MQRRLMFKPVRVNTFLAAPLLLLSALSSSASTSTNLLNVFYFEHAYVSAIDCASRGFPTKSIHADWVKANASTHDQVSDKIINDLLNNGLSRRQAVNELQGIRAQYRSQALNETRLSDKLCGAFREYLSNISTLRESKYISAPTKERAK